MKTPTDKIGPTVNTAKNVLLCGMCVHHKCELNLDNPPSWEHSCSHANRNPHMDGWIGLDPDETPNWCPELKDNKEGKPMPSLLYNE